MEELEEIYGHPNDASTVKVADRITPPYRILIEKSPFAALATECLGMAVPTLDGITRLRRDRMKPPPMGAELDSIDAPLPRGITALRDLGEEVAEVGRDCQIAILVELLPSEAGPGPVHPAALDEIEHRLDHPSRGEDFPVIGDALF